MSDISKMPDGLSNSIASFLKRTDKVSEELKNGRRERELSLMPEMREMSYGRDIRSTSVARASSVARQFEPSPIGTFHQILYHYTNMIISIQLFGNQFKRAHSHLFGNQFTRAHSDLIRQKD